MDRGRGLGIHLLLVEHIERFGLIRFHGGDHLVEHGPSFLGGGVALLCERGGRERCGTPIISPRIIGPLRVVVSGAAG